MAAARLDGPRVSVLLPAYDAVRTLPSALESVRRQSFADWECIVVDNGSSDGTFSCARSHIEQDGRFRALRVRHGTIVEALQAGLELCRGRYVARMDADDLMRRNRLALQVALLDDRPELAAVGCHVRLFPRAHLSTGLRAYERWLNAIDSPRQIAEESFVECPIAHPTLLARREILQSFGYREMGWPEDYDLILRWLGAGLKLGVVPRRLLSWRDSPARLSRTSAHCTMARFTACKAAFLSESLLRTASEYVLWGYGDTGKNLARALARHGRRPSHIVELHPGRIGQQIQGAPVIAPPELSRVPRRPVVVSVAGLEARTEIRQRLASMGFSEVRDFVCAA